MKAKMNPDYRGLSMDLTATLVAVCSGAIGSPVMSRLVVRCFTGDEHRYETRTITVGSELVTRQAADLIGQRVRVIGEFPMPTGRTYGHTLAAAEPQAVAIEPAEGSPDLPPYVTLQYVTRVFGSEPYQYAADGAPTRLFEFEQHGSAWRTPTLIRGKETIDALLAAGEGATVRITGGGWFGLGWGRVEILAKPPSLAEAA